MSRQNLTRFLFWCENGAYFYVSTGTLFPIWYRRLYRTITSWCKQVENFAFQKVHLFCLQCSMAGNYTVKFWVIFWAPHFSDEHCPWTEFGKHTFCVAAPRTWNSLPLHLRKPSADNSSSLGSKLISSNVHTYEFYLRELLRSELTYLLTKDQGKETPLTSRLYHTVYYIRYLCSSAFLFLRRAGTEYKPSVTDGRPHLSNDLPFTTSGQETGDFSSMSLSLSILTVIFQVNLG